MLDAVLALTDGASLTLAAPPAHARAARVAGRGRWLVGARKRPVVPAARLVRVEDHLRGHWTGATRLGGSFPWSEEEVGAILAAGWHAPGPGDGDGFVRFWPDDVATGPYLPLDDARRAVAAVAATFREVLAVAADDRPGGGLPALRTGAD